MSSDKTMLPAAALYVLPFIFAVALAIWLVRSGNRVSETDRNRLAVLFLAGIACQCLHFGEEYVTGLYNYFPPLPGGMRLTAGLFAGFNLFWIGIWLLSAWGIRHNLRIAWLPAWFFGLAMCLNGVAHPLLAIRAGGYFPGLITSPVVGIAGFLVTRKLYRHSISGVAQIPDISDK